MTARRASLRAQWLGQRLRELREAMGLTLADAADYVQRNPATVSRYESGEYLIRRPDLLALLDHYGVADRPQRDGLLRLAEDGWQRGWWDGFADDVEHRFVDYLWLEARAASIDLFSTMAIHGLLQTPQYAETIIRETARDSELPKVDRWVEARTERQTTLYRTDPPRVRVILDEPLLRRRVGTPECWRAQLSHLLTCAELPQVELRVLPARVVPYPAIQGEFTVFGLAEPAMDVGYVETLGGAVYVEPPASSEFVRVYDWLLRAALGPTESAARIRTILED